MYKPSRGGTITSIEKSEELANILNDRMKNKKGGANRRLAIMLGWLTTDENEPIKVNTPNRDRSMFSQEKYKFFLESPFEICNRCCNVMKKEPTHRYNHESGRHPMTAQMARESRLRTQKWLQNGCNGFHLREPISNPMAFWNESDVLKYIKQNNLEICSVYGDVVEDWEFINAVAGQMTISDVAGFEAIKDFDAPKPPLRTTGCKRTGCVFCGFGCHMDNRPNRFELIDNLSNPSLRDFCMRGGAFDSDGLWKPDNRGLGYWFVLKWINVHGGFDIYIPDYERYEKEYGNELTRSYLESEE